MKSTVTCYDSKLSLKTGKHFLYMEIKQNQCKKRIENSEFFLCPTRVKRRKTSFPNLELSW